VNWIELEVRAPAGRTSQLFRQAPGGTFVMFQTPEAGSVLSLRDENLLVGSPYCYRLEVSGGAQADEIHTRCMTTDWRVGFESPVITPVESAEVLRLFDWENTEALPEGTEDAPALYHMNLLIEGGDPLAEQGFRYMGMHVQSSPIFHEELEGWSGDQALARDCGSAPVVAALLVGPILNDSVFAACTPVGRWSFAAVPGRIFNEIRARMLDQIARGESPGVRALVFRRIPVAAALAPGVSRHVFDYVYLGEQGFAFNAIPECTTVDGLRLCETRQELLGWIVRKVVYWVTELGDAVIEGVRSTIGRITRLVKGEVNLDVQFRVLNTDPAFGTDRVMRSGWSGRELKLAGVKVEVRQGLASFFEHTDVNGHVRLEVAKNSDTKVCVKLENDVVEITEFLIETTVCVRRIGELAGDTSVTIDVREDYVNALVAMTDAREYLRTVVGHTMPKLTVLVGGNAMLLSPTGRSFAPCMGRVPSLLGLGADVVGALGSLLSPASLIWSTATDFLLSVDVVLLPGNDGSRGVPVHEYGHAVMCDLMLEQGLDAFEIAWTDVILQTASQGADDEGSYLNEAFADFVTAQVIGGTNYFAASGSVASEHVNYCASGTPCLEIDGSDRSTFQGQVQRVVTTLMDAFDGDTASANDGSHWNVSATPFVHQGTNDSNQNDEAIQLQARDLPALFSYWDARGTLLREDNFLGAIADLAEARGFAEADVCDLFALHDPSRSCPRFVTARPWLGWADQDSAVLAAFGLQPAPGEVGSFLTEATAPAFLLAVAQGAPEPAPDSSFEEGEGVCIDCSRVVVFEGVQKLKLSRVGKSTRPTAFAFRLGAEAFEAIDPLGQVHVGGWDARGPTGRKVRLHLGPDAAPALEELIAASAADLGVDEAEIRVTGPAFIELRLAKNGALLGKVVLPFAAQVEGRDRRGSLVAKLRVAGP
jgi:hypothetical protein